MQKTYLWSMLMITGLAMTAACGQLTTSVATTTPSATTATTATTVSNLQTVNNDLAPASLDYSANNASISAPTGKASDSGNPCAAADDLMDCQPILLQLYMELAQEILGSVVTAVNTVGGEMGALADGSAGTETVGGYSVEYSKTTDTDYTILMSLSSTPAIYIDVDGTTYTMTANLAAMSGASSSSTEALSVVVQYTDADTWDVNVFIDGLACTADDVRAPDKIKILVNKASGLWSGKAMLYSSLWRVSDSATCADTATDDTSMNFYTDFVGNATAAKANVYMMSRALSSLDAIADYELSDYQTNYGAGFGDTSVYPNAFCNPANTLDALWGNTCSALDATVGDAAFSSADNWVIPSVFSTQSVTVPTTL
jgi:hypothetical protein